MPPVTGKARKGQVSILCAQLDFAGTGPRVPLPSSTVESNGVVSTAALNASSVARALDNLLDNAFKYGCRAGGAIELRIAQSAVHVLIQVRDTGLGVQVETADRIFDWFVRLDDDSGGCGLGPAIVREVARSHRGDVRCGRVQDTALFELSITKT